jgi:hypothetical protein
MVPEAPPNRAAWNDRSNAQDLQTTSNAALRGLYLRRHPGLKQTPPCAGSPAAVRVQAEHSNDCWQFDLRFSGAEDKLCCFQMEYINDTYANHMLIRLGYDIALRLPFHIQVARSLG